MIPAELVANTLKYNKLKLHTKYYHYHNQSCIVKCTRKYIESSGIHQLNKVISDIIEYLNISNNVFTLHPD